VVITGLGFIAAPSLQDALAGKIGALPLDPAPEITAFEVPEGQPAWGFEALDFSIEKELPHIKSFIDRTSALALAAARHALADAGLFKGEKLTPEQNVGCAYGSTLGCLEAMTIFWNKVKTSNPKFAQPLPFTHGYANSPSSLMCIEHGLHGPSATFGGEKLAGMEALTFAFDHIASGAAEIILTGTSDSLTPAAHAHLFATGQLSGGGQWADGMLPGEGAAMLVLESETSAARRGARVYAELEGVNYFPIRPEHQPHPISVASAAGETVLFVSIPNIHPAGGGIQPLRPEMATVAAKHFTGDMLSVSPLLNVALAAGVLGGKFAIAKTTGEAGLPLLRPCLDLKIPGCCVATGFDPSGTLGVALLRAYFSRDSEKEPHY
jgi:3-oxoacyl-[acyl-carrier-protein] synthase II